MTTEAAVREVIDLQQRQLQDQHYDHTNVPDRRIVAYNENGGAVDVILSRVRIDESEVMHLVVHFEIARLKGKGWRVIAVQCADSIPHTSARDWESIRSGCVCPYQGVLLRDDIGGQESWVRASFPRLKEVASWFASPRNDARRLG
jgi:hypothetical protein